MGKTEFISNIIQIGDLPMGGSYPVRIQSMTNTNTMDVKSTVRQCIALIEAGCEMVRITTPGVKEAHQLEIIKNELTKQGLAVPLIADIHFNPRVAEVAAGIVEKVRINPGNYVDGKMASAEVISDKEYQEELHRIRERIFPLIEICKSHNTAIRIGVNHGSLSERIMNRYGDTPLGMVESALEFAEICRYLQFESLVLSMKSSDVKQMIYATRLLVQRMIKENMAFPIHLGVTEAGDGEDGRIKSAAGIGALLADGIGDTIRVSLTEDPVAEIPVARMITRRFAESRDQNAENTISDIMDLPLAYQRQSSEPVQHIGGTQIPAVSGEIPDELIESGRLGLVRFALSDPLKRIFESIQSVKGQKKNHPLIFQIDCSGAGFEEVMISASALIARLMIDGYGDGLLITDANSKHQYIKIELGILQALRLRISKTEYIACPSCGRTQFDIQDALNKIRDETSHLKGLKIGVMGCIVNGPGEMADADYGYVGSGNGKISLYKGKEMVQRNIDESQAVDALLKLIKDNGDWVNL
ncbi:MAG: (E)-4-hydroxy-3-methylbut-2-enyl-diphosphate synthase [Bacteroidota bacterium]|nr:(E)-4-hydroxy-3-methylbut-2-enyl-diphosphate synthase [Bacteroidota bacterium]